LQEADGGQAPRAEKILQDSPYFYSSRCTKGGVLTAEPELSGAEADKKPSRCTVVVAAATNTVQEQKITKTPPNNS